MSAEDPFAFTDSEPKPAAKKPHWRDKLFSRDKPKYTADQQVEAFLAPVRSKSVSHGRHAVAPSQREIPAPPRLEISHRWPSHDPQTASPISNPSPVADYSPPVNIPKAPLKTRKNKGLTVKFADGAPECIGEGGDEAEAPTIDISFNRTRSYSHSQSPSRMNDVNNSQDKAPQLRLNTSFNDGDRLRPREGGSSADRTPLLVKNAQDGDFLMALNLGDISSRLSFRASPGADSVAQRIRAKMEVEEGRALQQKYEDPTSPQNERTPDSPSSLYETPPISETGTAAPPSPIRTPPSPPPMSGSTNPDDLVLPPGLAPGGNTKPLSPQKSQVLPHDIADDSSRPSSKHNRNASISPQPPKYSLRSIASQLSETAFAEFKEYAAQHSDQILVSAESVKPLMETSLTEWVRAAVWWFMRGKKRLEAYARSRPSSSGARPQSRPPPESAKQAVIDLAKALWINENIVPQHQELTRYGTMSIDALLAVVSTTGDKQLAELLGAHQTVMSHLRSLAVSIKRNNILTAFPPDAESDTSVWMRYPFFAPDVSAVLSGATSRSMLLDNSGKGPTFVHTMPLGDTSRYFSYGSMFVDVCVSSSEDDSQQFSMPCALSILRDRADWYVFASITSQSDLINVMIQSDRKKGPTWDEVDWQVRSHSMRIKLPRGFELDVMFREDDFKMLWNIVQYTLKTEASLQPEAGESVVFEQTLKMFQYMDPGTPKAFPAESIERCRLRLFERSVTLTEGTGSRRAHRGFRITVLTTPKVKTLSSVRHILGYATPVVFGLLRGEDGAPALVLKVKEDGRTRSMLMTFHEVRERTTLHSLLLAMLPKEREIKIADVPIRAYTIEQPSDRSTGQPPKQHVQFPAGTVCVLDQEHDFVEHAYLPTILSEHLRAFVASEWGSVTDRINLGPGELKLGLDVNNRTGLSLYRPGQQDLTVSAAENLITPDMPDQLTDFLQTAMVKPMVRRFDFMSLKGLHQFERAVTGFKVLFDSVASSFIISRRRMVVPITKKWESSMARIQIVRHDKVVQLLAFLNDFSHGRCMNFVLKSTDTIENFNRSGKFCVRIVDAKFALPKTDDDPSSGFVCLDMPDYPGEHDDIAIAFDSEAVADLSGYDNEDKTSHIYSRLSAPNPTRFEAILSSLLNGEAISYSSGLSALHAALVLLNPGRIAIGNGYHGCHGVIDMFSRLTGLQQLDLDCPAEQLEAGDVIHLETPVNPEGTSFNIEAYAKKAHSRGAFLIVDGTFAPPPLQDPFQWGADLVMHSGSKYFGGHSDVLCGVLATQNKDWARKLFQDRLFLGSVMGNMESWLGVRSMRTLEVRVQRLSQNATNLVSWLHNALQVQSPAPGSDEEATQKALGQIFHSSLQKEDESWLQQQMPNGFGPVFSITMKEEDYARKLPSKLAFFQHATSLGGVESLIEWRTMSDKTVDRRLLRISIGLENWEDLRWDLVNAIENKMATFEIHYFSTASAYTGKPTERLPAPLPLSRLFETLEALYPGITERVLDSCSVSLGDEYVDVDVGEESEGGSGVVVKEGDEVAIIPPVSSG
ncbi:hypothetical protein BDW59DRAFT_172734 [Aspergillus cavernicola]|uniref:Molybdopterin synthase sulfur carrier subunit n=1 Tax=Aspergillus cavernicola TaxID=176166 RepID=A0ABR4ID79_9EURO